jgi:hypothetical protein
MIWTIPRLLRLAESVVAAVLALYIIAFTTVSFLDYPISSAWKWESLVIALFGVTSGALAYRYGYRGDRFMAIRRTGESALVGALVVLGVILLVNVVSRV